MKQRVRFALGVQPNAPTREKIIMPYDPFKHYRRSIRLKGYDYSRAGAYIVTICAHNRDHLFGEITEDGEMSLSEFGQIVREEWLRSKDIRKEIELDEWVVMPNHVHGIVVITRHDDSVGAHGGAPVLATERADSRPPLQRQPRSLGSFVTGFISSVTIRINQMGDNAGAPIWQRDYYEHIIHNEREWSAIAKYIRDNPANSRADLDNPANFSTCQPPKNGDEYWHDAGL